ncbi:serine/threonine-protein kinase [Kitasatospora sp. NPDC057223]|uniref:serine/threonine-protein kinase n=1 Tax=Kitasatospora sp. NPDC057223 TaxID=3346055 RepID=UPI0036324FBF
MAVTAENTIGKALFAGRYRVSSVLGHGGGADVLRAVDERLNREVALKVLRPGSTADTARRFGTEARVLARLRHPGLVEVYDYGTAAERPYLVLELVEGPTLAAEVRTAPLPAADVRRLGHDLAKTLAFVHAHGVVHRDVKPSNVLLDATGRPRLADFGAARLLDRQPEPGDEELTRTGLIVGTPAYLAPEQVRGQGAQASTDVYALGLLLIECLTGNREYTGTPIEAAAARLHRPPTIPPHLPVALATTLLQMTSMAPEHRPTAATCAQLLVTPEPATARPSPQPRKKAHAAATRTAVLIAASTLVLAGVAGSTAFGDAPQPAPRPATTPSAPPADDPVPAPVQDPPSSPPSPAVAPSVEAVGRPAAPPASPGPARPSPNRTDDNTQKEKGRKNDGGHGKKPK